MRNSSYSAIVFSLAFSLGACSVAPPSGPSDGGTTDPGFVPAPHEPLPQAVGHTTDVFGKPQLVTITFDGYPYTAEVERLGNFYNSSRWLPAVGAEYGITSVRHIARVHLPPAAATMSENELVTMLEAAIGTDLPEPSLDNDQLVYMVFVPKETKYKDSYDSEMCTDGYYGYHSYKYFGDFTWAFAVIGDCGGGINDVTSTASHELIEAATDPEDALYLDPPDDDPWSGMFGQEVADLCEDLDNVEEGGFALQRSWSGAAAAAGKSPCVPAPAGDIYRSVTPDPVKVPEVAAGSTVTFTLTGWSTGPSAPWELFTYVDDYSDFDPQPELSSTTIGNGTTVTATLTIPAGEPSGNYTTVRVYSDGGTYWPLTVVVK